MRLFRFLSSSQGRMTAYHIQDLRLLLPALDFELRVNEHYAKTNPSFREWLRELLRGGLASERTEELSNHRFDLLCSLCFPTIDPPQLLRVSKLCALTFLVNDGLVQEEAQSSQWLDPYVSGLNRSVAHGDLAPYPSLPNLDQLLRAADSMRAKQVQELQCSPHTTLGANVLRFASNLFSLFNPPREANTRSSHPGLPEFLITLENAYDCKFSGELTNVTVLEALWRCTTNITMWSQVIRWKVSRPVAIELNFSSGPCFILI